MFSTLAGLLDKYKAWSLTAKACLNKQATAAVNDSMQQASTARMSSQSLQPHGFQSPCISALLVQLQGYCFARQAGGINTKTSTFSFVIVIDCTM